MSHLIEGVPFISQLIKYPTGCESVACVMALQYLGYTGTVDHFIDELLDKGQMPTEQEDGSYKGADPWICFPGNPYSMDEGWGCFAPVLEKAVSRIPGFHTTIFYNKTLDELKSFIDQDIPVIFWGTINFATPRKTLCWTTPEDREIQWYSPMHCTLLIGYDDDGFIFNDPTSGERAHFSKDAVLAGYNAQGQQAMIIEKA